MASIIVLLLIAAGSVHCNDNSTIDDNVQLLYPSVGDPTIINSQWDIASIANKVLLGVILLIVIIAGVLAFRYFRLQRRRDKINKYKRLERNEDTLMRGRDEQEQEEEIIVYERD